MADLAKHASINGGTLIFELKTVFSLLTTKRTIAFAYVFVFVFIAFSVFLAFNPSSNSSSLWFTDTSFISISSSNNSSDQSYRSQFSSIFSHIFPNSSQQVPNFAPLPSPTAIKSQNTTFQSPITQKQSHNKGLHDRVEGFNPNQSTIGAPKSPVSVNQSANSLLRNSSERKNITGYEEKSFSDKGFNSNFSSSNTKNQSQSKDFREKVEVLKPNQSNIGAPKSPVAANQSMNSNITGNQEKRVAERGVNSNFTSSMLKKQSNGTNFGVPAKQRSENLVESLMNCDLFDGEWVRDESYPLYKPGSCSLIDEQFNCFLNGRPDNGYQKLKWKPKGCNLPRLNGSHMLELLRGKRLVFVGDSLNRNMWESLVCILRNSVKDQRKVYEASGRQQFRSQSSYSFVFEDYGFTIEFFVSPFLVQQWEMADKNGSKKETLRLDRIGSLGDQYKSADIIIFNTGHWWTHDKLSNGEQYYQEGSHVYRDLNVTKAFQKAITTWGRWVDAHINPKKTLVFFRGYSASHFSGGQWNSGGQCDNETEPIKNETYLSQYPEKMTVLESVLKGMKTRVSYLNVTRITDYRKDGHPSIYRKQSYSEEERRSPLSYQDCSHWCLPGVPDAWNELLYAELLIKQNLKKQQQKRP